MATPANACLAALGPHTLDSTTCAPVFGTPAERSANFSQRATQRLAITAGYESIDITYSEGALSPPRPISLASLQLLQTVSIPGCERVALVLIAEDLARRSGCATGIYAVRRDDKIGIKNAVTAIFSGGLLLSRDQVLRVLVPKDAEPPIFRMVWQSKWRIPETPLTSTASPSPFPRANGYGSRR